MDYGLVRAEAGKYYQTIGAVFSPALRELIYFSNHGFRHILFKRGRKGRARNQQIRRFSLLPLAVELIGLSTTHQEFEMTVEMHRRKNKMVRYWGIIAILRGEKIKVVIRKMGENGMTHFWSIIPDFQTSPKRDEKLFGSKPQN